MLKKATMVATERHPLVRLVCGDPRSGSELAEILEHLDGMLTQLLREISHWRQSERAEVREPIFVPFLGRSLLEVALTALLGRLDPFRLLVLREVQIRRPDHIKQKNPSAIQWTGDILPKDEKKNEEPWATEQKLESMTRALLGTYYDYVFWQKAFERLLDQLSEESQGGDWMRKLRRLESRSFVPKYRQQVGSHYSWFSKGIHHEFLIPQEGYYERREMVEKLDESVEAIAALALVANMSSHTPYALSQEDALAAFEQLQATGEQDEPR